MLSLSRNAELIKGLLSQRIQGIGGSATESHAPRMRFWLVIFTVLSVSCCLVFRGLNTYVEIVFFFFRRFLRLQRYRLFI